MLFQSLCDGISATLRALPMVCKGRNGGGKSQPGATMRIAALGIRPLASGAFGLTV